MKKATYVSKFYILGLVLLAFNLSLSGQSITITAPGNWGLGTTHNIAWTPSGTTGTFDIDLVTPAGALVTSIATGVAASPYSWTIDPTGDPSLVLGSYKIRITDQTPYSESSAQFDLIDASVTVTAPVAGNSWGKGTTHNITWTQLGMDGNKVDIELWLDGGAQVGADLSNNTINAETGTYSWSLDAGLADGTYRIKFVNHATDEVVGTSDAFSVIVPTVTVTAPVASAVWQTGSAHSITWTTTGGSFNVDIEYWANGAGSGTVIQNNVSAASPYSWTPSAAITPGLYTIKIFKNGTHSVVGTSDGFYLSSVAPYITVTGPNGGESWLRGSTYTIAWHDNLTSYVKVELYKGGAWYRTLRAGVNVNSISYTVPYVLPYGTDYKIKITNNSNSACYDYSDANFSIVAPPPGTVTVTDPADCERGTLIQIAWTKTFTQNVNVELWDATATTKLSTIRRNVYGSATNYFVPASLTPAHYTIKVIKYTDATIYDFSLPFEVTQQGGTSGLGTVTANDPADIGRETLMSLTWTKTFSENVNVELWDATATSKVMTIRNNVYGTGTNWFVPATFTLGHYTIKVIKKTDATIYDFSAAFEITQTGGTSGLGTVTANTPLDSDCGTLINFSWSKTFSENVNVELWDATATSFVRTIRTNVYGSGCTWFIPADFTPEHYTIKVIKKTDATIFDFSPAFEIIGNVGGTITVTYPNNAGITIATGSLHVITWTKTCSENVKVELWKGAAKYSTIKYSQTGTSCNWYVSSFLPEGSDYSIKVMSIFDGSIIDESDNDFTIAIYDNFTVYPNPVNNTMNLRFTDNNSGVYDVRLYNRFGVQVLETTTDTDAGKEFSLNTSSLADGMYYLVLTSGEDRITRTVLVQH